MKNRSIYIVISILTLSLGIIAVLFCYQYNFSRTQTDIPRFSYMSGNPNCESANYRFQSSTEPKVFGADCILCRELGRDMGNIGVYKKSTSAEDAQFSLKFYLQGGIITTTAKTDNQGSKIGESLISISKNNDEIVDAKIGWTENNDLWIIDAPTLELAKEFEESKTFKNLRADIDSACR